MNPHKTGTLAGLTTVVLVMACLPANHSIGRPAAHDTSGVTSHWVQDARLRDIMKELETLESTTWPQEVEAEYKGTAPPGAASTFQQARELAEGLGCTADEIPKTVAHIRMTEVDRRSFLAQVETLKEQAQRLERSAASFDRGAMRRDLSAINETCLSCHDRFRDFSGPMERK